MAGKKFEVGSQIYLFCQERSHAPRLIISSHGGRAGKTFHYNEKPDLLFYAEDKQAMIDQSIASITRQSIEPVSSDTVTGFADEWIQDYELSKYQSHEGEGPETYASLLDEVNRLGRECKSENDLWDIVTIRNRSFSKTPTLGLVIEELKKHQGDRFADYDEIHCSFCRVE